MIVKKTALLCCMVVFTTISSSCNKAENNTNTIQTNVPAIITTINSSSSPSTLSISSTTTPQTTHENSMLLKGSEIVDVNGNLGLFSSEPARIGFRISSTMRVYDWVPELIQSWVPGEVYAIHLTLLEVMRGKYALDYLDDLGFFYSYPYYKSLPEAGYEYIVAAIEFEYYARDLPGNIIYKMEQGSFMSYSQDSIEYNTPFILPWKENAFDYDITPGDVIEIKIAIVVKTVDKKPLMLFKKGDIWFSLY
jgi:hypothetical protein